VYQIKTPATPGVYATLAMSGENRRTATLKTAPRKSPSAGTPLTTAPIWLKPTK